ncbi:hypothetical protein [Citrobacter sedlakii]|uniref:hypothetical protein n=1 Tax=Citrobacter sedlakii TaxID=67826 RepID=UPI0020BE9144|nr:hypothetical protein [Citrobacter sedlakii]MCK8147073.1 hypothetical protein [Citrobacter sedlakii]
MTTRQTRSAAEAILLIQDGSERKIELAFDVNADEFFTLSRLTGDKGGKITKPGEYFVISLKNFPVPPQQ